jgi:transposase
MSHERHTVATTLLPPTYAVRLTHVTVEKASIRVQLTAIAPTAACPRCGIFSSSIHRRYQRHLTDLPWGTRLVRIQCIVRKFICRNLSCERRIFTERLPALVATDARKTHRVIMVLQAIGIALGGQAGARLAARLRLAVSAATLLRLVQAASGPDTSALQAIGVDEWAWRRGHRYGTILVDLATHRVVDLLPDRSAASVAAWLAQHLTITVVGRDRSPLYADGICQGVPDAVQVVDRFHLVHNLREAVEAFLTNQRGALQAAAVRTAQALMPPGSLVPVTPMYQGRRRSAPPQQHRADPWRQPRHAPWVEIYGALHTLHAQGIPVATIARQLGISRPTVYAYLRRTTPPGPKRPPFQWTARVVTPYLPYLIRGWRESGTDSMRLCRFITQRRRASEAGLSPETQASPYPRPQGPSPRAVSVTRVCRAGKRSPDAEISVAQLWQLDPSIARAYALSHAFLDLVRERRGVELEAWMAEAMHGGIEELARFAHGLRRTWQQSPPGSPSSGATALPRARSIA